jgi:hypothetical protein
MNFPASLRPTCFQKVLLLPIRWFREIPKVQPVFKEWKGRKVRETYGGKAILDFYGKPEFAELGILRLMEHAGWSGVWVDTFRNAFRTQYWPANRVDLPPKHQKLFDRIAKKAKCESGCFDVFCWKDDRFFFIESKRGGQDRIRPSQRRWLQGAIWGCRIPLNRFLIVEWALR